VTQPADPNLHIAQNAKSKAIFAQGFDPKIATRKAAGKIVFDAAC